MSYKVYLLRPDRRLLVDDIGNRRTFATIEEAQLAADAYDRSADAEVWDATRDTPVAAKVKRRGWLIKEDA